MPAGDAGSGSRQQ